jgi:hypothetical protein
VTGVQTCALPIYVIPDHGAHTVLARFNLDPFRTRRRKSVISPRKFPLRRFRHGKELRQYAIKPRVHL